MFEDQDLRTMKWPAQIPNLNPIEHAWSYLKKKLEKYEIPPNSMEQLWKRVEKEWNEIPAQVCQGLIVSMPRRINEVVKAEGGYTKY